MVKSRRDFIKISVLGTTGVAVGSRYLFAGNNQQSEQVPKTQFKLSSEFTRIPTYCEVCFWKCAAWAHVDHKGKIVKLTGNEKDQNCHGRLCPRGTGGLGM